MMQEFTNFFFQRKLIRTSCCIKVGLQQAQHFIEYVVKSRGKKEKEYYQCSIALAFVLAASCT